MYWRVPLHGGAGDCQKQHPLQGREGVGGGKGDSREKQKHSIFRKKAGIGDLKSPVQVTNPTPTHKQIS